MPPIPSIHRPVHSTSAKSLLKANIAANISHHCKHIAVCIALNAAPNNNHTCNAKIIRNLAAGGQKLISGCHLMLRAGIFLHGACRCRIEWLGFPCTASPGCTLAPICLSLCTSTNMLLTVHHQLLICTNSLCSRRWALCNKTVTVIQLYRGLRALSEHKQL